MAIHSSQEYFELVQGDYKDKYVFVDFYMENCPWCYYILDDFNRIIKDMTEWYGAEKVAFVKIDGTKIRKLADLYSVPSYPHFVGVLPNTNGKSFI